MKFAQRMHDIPGSRAAWVSKKQTLGCTLIEKIEPGIFKSLAGRCELWILDQSLADKDWTLYTAR